MSANAAHWPQLRETMLTLGLCVGPDDIYLTLRGLRTLAVRLDRHQQSAFAVARWLQRFGDDPDLLVEQIPFTETQNYLRIVYDNYWHYQALYGRS